MAACPLGRKGKQLRGLTVALLIVVMSHSCGMRRLVDLAEFGDGDVGVNLGGAKVGMAEHGLNGADVSAIFQACGGADVAEEIPRAGLSLVRAFCTFVRRTRPSRR